MKKVIALAFAFVAIAIVSAPEANAQSFSSGFQFGSGVNASGGFGGFSRGGNSFGFSPLFRGGNRIARPPFFAQFPPVYYNGIVRRPYGISPFAAPAGVVPVELQVQQQHSEPAVVSNPFFNNSPNSKPVSVLDEKDSPESTENKSTQVNPFFNADPASLGPAQTVSFESVER